MANYLWKARTIKGEIQNGEVAAESQNEVINYLRQKRLIIVSVRKKPKELQLPTVGSGIKSRELVIFTRQFATMINAGLPLVQCLDVLSRQTVNPRFKKIIGQVMSDVESGHTLADSMVKHSKVFNNLYVNTVAAGEAGGILDTILARLATYLEKNDAIIRKVKGAMIYPSVIMTVAILATVFLLIFVIPVFAKMFASSGLELPLPTKVVLGISDFLRESWWLLIVAIVGIAVIIGRTYRTDNGKLSIDKFLLKIPVFGDVLLKSSVSRFTRTLGTMVSSGVAILDALNITAKTAGNRVIHDAVLKARASIASGDTISGPLQREEVFPPMVVQMINVGEQTGGLDEMLAKIADFYDDEVDTAVTAMTSIIEPILIVVMGILVGGMLAAMYLPMFDIFKTVQ